jgi:hypothetical protein
VTSTLSVGDIVYRAIEDRESLRSGNRVGPRFFATGEPFDGNRIYYNFMRPTTSMAQMDVELSRARELDYDYIKTYVRLPADRMARAVEEAQRMGVPSGSHYMSPGLFVGQDGTTHLTATQRLGYPRTASSTNLTYQDVIEVYGQGRRSVMTTTNSNEFLFQREFDGDPRLQLFPSWVREELLEDVEGNTTPPSDPECATEFCRRSHTFKRIMERGGSVLTGTDAPLEYWGVGMHSDLRTRVGYGWSPYEALVTATRLPAELLGVADDLGTLEPGKLADMVFVEGNPLERIEDAMQVRMTMQNGKLFTVEELVQPFSMS